MMEVTEYSISGQGWQQTHAANYTTNGYATRIPTTTQPTGDGVIPLGFGGSVCPRWLTLMPIGVGSDDNTFLMQLRLWRVTNLQVAKALPLWINAGSLGEWTCTLGTSVGVAGSDLGATTRFCDTIVMTGGATLPTTPIVEKWLSLSPLADQIGFVVVPTFGFQFAEVMLSTGGVATSCNVLWTVQ